MRRSIPILLIILPLLAACSIVFPVSAPPTSVATTVPTALPSLPTAPTISPSPPASLSPSTPTPQPPTPSASLTAYSDQPVPSKVSSSSSSASFSVRFHPDGALYVGDLVSLEVIVEDGRNLDGLEVQVMAPDGTILGPMGFGSYGIERRTQATLTWVWDTTALEQGEHTLAFSLLPDGESWTETVSLLPVSELPYPEPGAHWSSVQSDCCVVNYVTGTTAERDLEVVMEAVEGQYQRVAHLMGTALDESIHFTLLPRVLGHGGFASQEVSISYLDRNYAGGTFDFVLGHEIIHKMDEHLGGDLMPSILVEGLAVYMNGGHFKPEPLMARAAALLPPEEGCAPVNALTDMVSIDPSVIPCALDWYIPLEELSDDFYLSQHEIGYLQAGALVEFIVSRWGWQAYDAFYRDIHMIDPGSDDNNMNSDSLYRAIDRALQDHLGVTYTDLESQFLEALQGEGFTVEMVNDVRLTVEYYDTVRRYQQLLDPSAYFLSAWLVDGEQMRERGIVADYLRHPAAPENIALETMLVAADSALRAGDYFQAQKILSAANAFLDGISNADTGARYTHPLAGDYYAVVQTLLTAGYQPQRLQFEEERALAWVTRSGVDLIELRLAQIGGKWQVLK